jgi:hypothetical protein
VSRDLTVAGTDRQRLQNVFDQLTANGVAYWFDLRGSQGSFSERWEDYNNNTIRCGTDRWVGDHVGNRDTGGAYWDDEGVLRTRPNGAVWNRLMWSFNHEHPDLAVLLVRLFTEQGFDVDWNGDPFTCVIVTLASPS